MTTQNAVDIYNVLLDKYGSPSIEPDEIVGHLNMATFEWLNRLSPDNQGGIVNFEFDANVAQNIKPLVFTITENMDSNGLLSNSDINAALVTESSDAAATVFRVMSIGITVSGVTYPVTFLKQNNIWRFNRNYFKRPTTTKSRFTFVSNGLVFYPTNTTGNLIITVIKNPKLLSLTGPVNPELSDYSLYQIIAIALKLGGIEIRDENLIEDVRLAGLQNMQ